VISRNRRDLKVCSLGQACREMTFLNQGIRCWTGTPCQTDTSRSCAEYHLSGYLLCKI